MSYISLEYVGIWSPNNPKPSGGCPYFTYSKAINNFLGGNLQKASLKQLIIQS